MLSVFLGPKVITLSGTYGADYNKKYFVVAFISILLLHNTFTRTVKPVYNGHLWDLKNVAVMQRVV